VSVKQKKPIHVGVLSDTHGLLRPQVVENLLGVEMIIHAGDVGNEEILDTLKNIAPVTAVRGNTDWGIWTQGLRAKEAVEVGGILLYVLHNIDELDLEPAAAGFSVVVYGHSHQPSLHYHRDVLYLNPGGAGQRRFDYPITIALLHVNGSAVEPQILELDV